MNTLNSNNFDAQQLHVLNNDNDLTSALHTSTITK